jgi:hypothetical protein
MTVQPKFLIFDGMLAGKLKYAAKRFDPSPYRLDPLRKTSVFPMSCGRIIETLNASDK